MSRSRGWVVVINNYNPEEEKAFQELDCRYVVYGREVAPSTGTPHLQGYVYFSSKKSLAQLKVLFPRAKLLLAKGTPQQNRTYCVKDGDFYERGELPMKGRAKDENKAELNEVLLNTPLKNLVEEGTISLYSVPTLSRAKQILAQQNDPYSHHDVRGVWYFGPPGTGKSRRAREENPSAYIKAQNKWFDGYSGEKAIILDDLDTGTLGHYLKIWGDRYSCSGEIKGGTVNLVHELFIITSNYHPDKLWPDDEEMCKAIKRRFLITEFFIQGNH
jgi:hypothetical protein